MSSILRALKKLEREQPPLAGASLQLRTAQPAGAGLELRKEGSGTWVAVIIAGLLLAVGGGYWLYTTRSGEQTGSLPPTPNRPETDTSFSTAQDTGHHPDERSAPASTFSGPRHIAPVPEADGRYPTGHLKSTTDGKPGPEKWISTGDNGARPKADQEKLPKGASVIGSVTPGTKLGLPDEKPGSTLSSPSPGLPSAPSVVGPESYPDPTGDRSGPSISSRDPSPADVQLLDRPDLSLQAISWSETPEQRIAVINSRVVHEGDTVAEFRVSRINADDVIVEAGGEIWKLAFTPR